MIKIDILRDEDLQGVVKKFISALLPTENYASELFSSILQVLFKYVHLEELEMEYFLLVESLSELAKIQAVYPDYVVKLEKDTFDSLVEVSVMDAVVRPELGVKEWLEWECEDSNLDNEVVREKACQRLSQRCSDLYEECFDMAVSSKEVLSCELELSQVFKQAVSTQMINTQAEILRGSLRIGRRLYSGASDALKYAGEVLAEAQERFAEDGDGTSLTVDSIEKVTEVLKGLEESYTAIADWGIPPIDDGTPILRHRLVVVVANENVGKTQFIVDKAVNVVLASGRVLIMCGESTKGSMYYLMLKNYIWKRFGITVREKDVLYPDDCPEEIAKMIRIAMLETIENGKFSFIDEFSYNGVRDELQAEYNRNQFDMVVIDHSMALRGKAGDGSMHSNISALSMALKDFKKKNPVCVLVSSHTSTFSKEALAKGKNPDNSTTKGSNDLSADADEVFVLATSESLDKQGLIKFINAKRRGRPRIVEPIYLRKKFEVSAFIYDENSLAEQGDMTIDQQEALSVLEDDLRSEEYPF